MDKFHSSKEIPTFKCDYDGCDKQYHVRDSLRKHIDSIHLKIPVIKVHKNLICETCGKSCRSGFALKVFTFPPSNFHYNNFHSI